MSKSFITMLLAAAMLPGASVMAQETATLASWTFETAYEMTENGADKTYTPVAGDATDTGAQWFNSAVPHILPETSAGEASAYDLSAYSEGRYWQLCNGYNKRVLRIENTVENVSTDFTDPANHKAYYQLTFPTTGYKDIDITFSIAPGNNTETPVEMVMSTDGGQSWFDAGAKNTSAVWFQYADQTMRLSANNKEKVIVRLLPTAGTTNWNLSNISISGSEMEALPGVDNADVQFAWPMGTTSPAGSAQASNPDIFSVYELAIGDGLTISGVGSITGGSAQTKFKPSNNNSNELKAEDALVFTVAPKKGVQFKPTSLSFQASKHGTGGGAMVMEVKQGDKTMRSDDLVAERNGQGNNFTRFNEAISGFDLSSEPVTVTLYIYKLASNKEAGLADITLYGVADGQVQPVPVYTFSLKSAVEGAGSLSCAPAGNEFDEGTLLTVRATENFGYHFTNWTDANGAVVSESNPYSFNIIADTELTANFDKNNVYALKVALEGGANVNQVLFTPEGHIVDGVHYYEEGTYVRLSTTNNRILTFTNWEDNTTAPEREVLVDSDKDLTATFSAADYIVGWDFYFDEPASERAADFKDETDNAGLLSLHNAEGKTTSWLSRGVSRGAENGKWGARIWKNLTDRNYFEASFSTVGYSNIVCSAALGIQYNSYTTIYAQYSVNGTDYTTFGTYNLQPGWTSNEFALPAEAAGQSRLWIRFMPDYDSPLAGNTSDYDGLCIAELFILADKDALNDDKAPELVSVIPASGSEGASATGSIILTFNEKVQLGSGDATLNGTVLTPRLSGKSVIYPYAGLDYNTEYTFKLPAGAVTDRSGNAFAGTTTTFRTMERVQPEARLFDAIVAADGSGDYTTLQAAIDAAPVQAVKPWLIFVKNGNYKEHVNIPANKPMMHIIGQDRDKAVILDDKLCGGENAYHVSEGATVVVNANDCFFENITLENSYGHEQQAGPQALALNTAGDRTIFNNVAMLSYQDTWITPSTSNYRAYVRNSFIEGAVDFIYNSGNIYIDNTTLYINRKSGGYIVAPSHAADVEWGYVFNNCTITAPGVPSETSVWLGRPWHNQPKTVFLNTRAEVTIPATGWYETMGGLPAIWADWNTVDGNGNPVDLSQRRDTYYYIDSNGKKVYGTAKNHLTDEEAAEYTIRNVLTGKDNWEPVIKTESCDAPRPIIQDNGDITWEPVPYAICYLVTRGEEVLAFTTDTIFEAGSAMRAAADSNAEYTVQAVNEFGGLSEKAEATIETVITDIEANGEGVVTGIYDLQGRALSHPAKGVNIVRTLYPDGTVKVSKILVK